jgi:hypothetical protein
MWQGGYCMKRYIFGAEFKVDGNDVHGLIAELFKKEEAAFRVKHKEKLIVLETERDLDIKNPIKVQRNVLTLLSKEEIKPILVSSGKTVILKGTVQYCRRVGDIKVGLFDGSELNMDFANIFASRNLGVSLKRFVAVKNKERWDGKVWIKNSFSFELEGVVENEEVLNRSQVAAVGGRKSYGFGWVEMNVVE